MEVRAARHVDKSLLRLDQIRYVTESLASHQDLFFVVLGVMFLLQSTGKIWKIPGWFSLLALLGFLIAFLRIPKYYEKRFGAVEAKSPSNKGVVIFVVVMVVLFIWGRQIEPVFSTFSYRLSHRIHLLISDPTEQIELFPSMLWVFTFTGSLRKCSRSVDPHEPYFAFLAMVSCVVIATCPLLFPSVKQVALWKFLNDASFGLTFIALGLYNHFALLRLLPRTAVENEEDE